MVQSIRLKPISTVEEAIVIISSLTVVGSFFWVPLVFMQLYRKCETTKAKIALFAALLAAIFVPLNARKSFRQNRMWDAWHAYFSTQIRQEGALTGKSGKIFVVIPHGIFPFGGALSLVGKLGEYLGNPLPVVASAAMRVPVFGHLIQSMGAVPANKTAIGNALQAGKNLSLIPGGIAEIFAIRKREEVALLKDRKGFVRLALQHGAPLVPVYVFGTSRLLRLVKLPEIVERMSRWFRISLTPFWGRFGLPVPFRLPLLYVKHSIPNFTPNGVQY
jgi:2-acylglycerol O-acyltransferase 2